MGTFQKRKIKFKFQRNFLKISGYLSRSFTIRSENYFKFFWQWYFGEKQKRSPRVVLYSRSSSHFASFRTFPLSPLFPPRFSLNILALLKWAKVIKKRFGYSIRADRYTDDADTH